MEWYGMERRQAEKAEMAGTQKKDGRMDGPFISQQHVTDSRHVSIPHF